MYYVSSLWRVTYNKHLNNEVIYEVFWIFLLQLWDKEMNICRIYN